MDQFILSKIRQFRGYAYEAAGVVSGFFNSPNTARACGEQLRSVENLQIQICGTQLTVWY